MPWFFMKLWRSGAELRPVQPCFTCSAPERESCWSSACGRRLQGQLRRSSSCGRSSHKQEIRRFPSCWEPSVPPWHCSDPAAGRWILAFLDGSASTFETERVRPHTSFGLVLPYFKGYSSRSDMVYEVTPSGVVRGRHRLHNARNEQRCSKGASLLG